jgi:hypothetical protein
MARPTHTTKEGVVVLELKTKKEQATNAYALATGLALVRYRATIYIPADYETLETSVTPPIERTIWLPLSREWIKRLAANQFNTMFSTDADLAGFEFMVGQCAQQIDDVVSSLLIRTSEGLRELNDEGVLVEPTGEFRPNYLQPLLNTDAAEKARILTVIAGWLDSEEEAESLLRHLATMLAPGWSAVKYVLLLGDGRNGKSLMLKMVEHLFGRDNVSNVTRQMISEQSATVTELNGKLVNIVYDGRAEYLKDSGTEKSLVAGEPVPIRRLYESTSTTVQTNALFLEGLNREPKTHDKSSALQKRLVRFHFPNVYEINHKFEKQMLNREALGAFLSLLIDRYVSEDQLADKLKQTTKALELQLEQMHTNSAGLQYLKYFEEHDALGTDGLINAPFSGLVDDFRSWRLRDFNDINAWSEPDVLALFNPLLVTERKTQRIGGKPRKVRIITAFKPEVLAFIDSLKGGDEDAAFLDALVDDGELPPQSPTAGTDGAV